MSKLVAILAIYAAGVTTWLLVSRPAAHSGGGGPSVADRAAVQESDTRISRELMTHAREMFRAEIRDVLRSVDFHVGRLEAIRKSMDEGLEATRKASEDAAQGSFNKLEAMDEQVRKLADLAGQLEGVHKAIAAFEERVAAVEARPPQIIREIVEGGAGPARPAEPTGPVLPPPPTKDPEVVAAEIAKARQDIMSDKLDILFPAIEKIREHRVLDAVPRLLQLLEKFPDEFGRTAAATALGKMQVVDAVPGLVKAMTDTSGLVAQQANKSIREITLFDTGLSATARIRERRKAANRFKEWWRAHEDAVRARLGQPKSEDPDAPK